MCVTSFTSDKMFVWLNKIKNGRTIKEIINWKSK